MCANRFADISLERFIPGVQFYSNLGLWNEARLERTALQFQFGWKAFGQAATARTKIIYTQTFFYLTRRASRG
jgi:hypothetical protein